MPSLPDYADWLNPPRLQQEEKLWAAMKLYQRYAAAIVHLVESRPGITAITEFGGGTGWVPWELKLDLPYTMVDRHSHCLKLAADRNATKAHVTIVKQDIRKLNPTTPLVCGFAVLKHFRLTEWQELFINLFAGARYGLFTMPIAPANIDDGIEFTHTRVTEEFLADCIALAGHRELWRDRTDPEEPLIAMEKID